MDRLVTIRSSRYGLDIELDQEADFDALLEILADKFRSSARFFKDAKMALSFSGRHLTRTEEEKILQIISENTQIDILCVVEQNDKNEPMYRSIVEQSLTDISKRDGQFYRGTLGKREILESDSSIVILGDVELGARVVAKGSVVIVGSLYGAVHAGASGDRDAFVVALSMQPKQLCIGDIEAKRQVIYQESLNIRGPKIAVVDGGRIYLDPLVD
ncbi:MAG TPA: septum formation inhibitor [Candidatus Mediterraneibacter intestinipullorum]|nr:septum formation inhibitor [Candidatus Mediterraneibacter intestinipullorum]